MAELNFDIEIPVRIRSFRGVMAVALVFAVAGDLASESVTLTTFYPAPSGVYSQLVTAQMAYAARDSGYVEMGTYQAAPTATLTVNGGYVGIGTVDPSATPGCPLGTCPALQVYDSVGGAVIDVKVTGRIQTGDLTNPGGVCLNSGCTQTVGTVNSGNGAANFGLINSAGGINGLIMSGAYTGIGLSATASAAAPLATLDVGGTINFSDCTGVPTTNFSGGYAACGGNTYATFAPGLLTYYQTASDFADDVGGKMYCCPCPGGVACPL